MSDVILGAVIALIGALGAPWVKDSIERRSRAREQLKVDTREEVLRVIAALSELQRARLLGPRDASFARAHAEAAVAGTRLSILVPKRDHEHINRAVSFTIESISDGEKRAIVVAAMQTCAGVLARWARGEIHGETIHREFSNQLEDNLREFTA